MGERVKKFFDYANLVIPTVLFLITLGTFIFTAGKLTASIQQNVTAIQENTVQIQKNSADIVELKTFRAGVETEIKSLKDSNDKDHNLIINLLDKTDKKIDKIIEKEGAK